MAISGAEREEEDSVPSSPVFPSSFFGHSKNCPSQCPRVVITPIGCVAFLRDAQLDGTQFEVHQLFEANGSQF